MFISIVSSSIGAEYEGGGGGLKIDLQPLNVISPTASLIQSCMQVYAGVLVVSLYGPVLFGPKN